MNRHKRKVQVSTKVTRLVDILPSVLGVVFFIFFLLSEGRSTVGPRIMFVCGAATLITAIASTILALAQRRFVAVHYVNLFWIVVSVLFWIWTVFVLLTFRFTF
jgi:hypothetical protein